MSEKFEIFFLPRFFSRELKLRTSVLNVERAHMLCVHQPGKLVLVLD
jgi:hypothetical protein